MKFTIVHGQKSKENFGVLFELPLPLNQSKLRALDFVFSFAKKITNHIILTISKSQTKNDVLFLDWLIRNNFRYVPSFINPNTKNRIQLWSRYDPKVEFDPQMLEETGLFGDTYYDEWDLSLMRTLDFFDDEGEFPGQCGIDVINDPPYYLSHFFDRQGIFSPLSLDELITPDNAHREKVFAKSLKEDYKDYQLSPFYHLLIPTSTLIDLPLFKEYES